MSQWKISTGGLVILGILIFLMLLIAYLPDVDLPDAAFHNGTAPTVIHAHATSTPAPICVAAACSNPQSHGISRFQQCLRVSPGDTAPNFRPILLRSIRC
jgi:hypothetical protein